MGEQGLNIHEGTAVYVEAKGVRYGDGKARVMLHSRTKEGSILLLKDADNCLRFYHELTNRGRTVVEYDISSLSSETGHIFIITWSIERKEAIIYLDGKPVASKVMES